MKVLVTGGTGFVGRHLCAELYERGHEVTALARSPEDADLPADVRRVRGDVTDYDSIEAAFEGQDVVVNLVALSPLFTPKGGNERHFEVHLGGTENVVRAADEHGVRKVVQMSGVNASSDAPTAYLRAKGRAEEVVRDSDLEWVIVRPTVIVGEGDEFVEFTKKVAPPYVTPLPGGGRTRFQVIHIDDITPMLAEAAEGDEHNGHVYEIGGADRLTLAELARLIHRAEGRSATVVPIPMALAGVGMSVGSVVPGFPFGPDQYRSLKMDLTVADNDVDAFGVDEGDLTTFREYLGLDG